MKEMKEIIFKKRYYRSFGDYVTKTYFRENEQLYCKTYISGYWSNESKIEPTTTDEVEKAIRVEQDKHICELAKLQENLKNLWIN